MAETADGNPQLGGVTPILRVQDLARSLDYYVHVLGLSIDWEYRGIIASVSRDRCGIFLCEGNQGHPGGWVWVGASDIEPLFAELRARGATIRHAPTNDTWAYEMQVEDPDGNVLRIGSEPKADRQFGEWIEHARRQMAAVA